jgi:hypothetical protein
MAGIMLEVVSTAHELITDEPLDNQLDGTDKALALREKPMGHNIAEKLRGDAFDITIRLAVEASTSESIVRSLWYAFRSLDADNSFMLVSGGKNEWRNALSRHPGWKINHDYLSTREASMLLQLPTGALQQEFGLESVAYRETKLPKTVTKGGLQIGEVTYHGDHQPVYLPINDHDELCLPHCVIGGMGCGKTMGFGANLAVEAVKAGMGAVVIDPAKGELGDEIEAALPKDQIIRIRFGREPISLDWRECLHGERQRNRLANELVAFCEASTDEAGAQTIRYMRACAKASTTGRLSEMVSILTNPSIRSKLLSGMREQEQEIWQQFDQLGPARQSQIALPVLNRLDVITGDDYLADCMDSNQGIDFVELLQVPRAIILDIPKSALGKEAVDVLAAMVATKLDLAMTLRKSQHPVFIVQDEPHQYCRSARIWESAAVESRKWRFSYVWMFHAIDDQIPKHVFAIIKSALPHYHIYTSSQDTYKALASEIKPFDTEEAMATPMHWAINVIRAGGVTVTPFLARMMAPPSKRLKEQASILPSQSS